MVCNAFCFHVAMSNEASRTNKAHRHKVLHDESFLLWLWWFKLGSTLYILWELERTQVVKKYH